MDLFIFISELNEYTLQIFFCLKNEKEMVVMQIKTYKPLPGSCIQRCQSCVESTCAEVIY